MPDILDILNPARRRRSFLPPSIYGSDMDGLTGQGELSDSSSGDTPAPSLPPDVTPPSSIASDPASSSLPPTPHFGGMPAQPPASSEDDQAIGELRRRLMAEPGRPAQPKLWRQIVGGVVAGMGGNLGAQLAPLIEYGSTGAQQLKAHQQWQQDSGTRLAIGKMLTDYEDKKQKDEDRDLGRQTTKDWHDQLTAERAQKEKDEFGKQPGAGWAQTSGGGNIAVPSMQVGGSPLPNTPPPLAMTQPQAQPQPTYPPGFVGPKPPLPSPPPRSFIPPGTLTPPSIPTQDPGVTLPPSQIVAPPGKIPLGRGEAAVPTPVAERSGGYSRFKTSPSELARQKQEALEQDWGTLPPAVATELGITNPTAKIDPKLMSGYLLRYDNRLKARGLSIPALVEARRAAVQPEVDAGHITPREASLYALGYKSLERAAATGTAQANREEMRADRSYEARNKELNAFATPFNSMNDDVSRFYDALSQMNPEADTTLAPQLIKTLIGGKGSGLRITQAEINASSGGQAGWQQLQSAIEKWVPGDKDHPFKVLPAQRQQMFELIAMMHEKAKQKLAIIQQADDALLDPDVTVAQQRRIVANVKKALTGVDEAQSVGAINKLSGAGIGDRSGAGSGPPSPVVQRPPLIIKNESEIGALPVGTPYIFNGKKAVRGQ